MLVYEDIKTRACTKLFILLPTNRKIELFIINLTKFIINVFCKV